MGKVSTKSRGTLPLIKSYIKNIYLHSSEQHVGLLLNFQPIKTDLKGKAYLIPFVDPESIVKTTAKFDLNSDSSKNNDSLFWYGLSSWCQIHMIKIGLVLGSMYWICSRSLKRRELFLNRMWTYRISKEYLYIFFWISLWPTDICWHFWNFEKTGWSGTMLLDPLNLSNQFPNTYVCW